MLYYHGKTREILINDEVNRPFIIFMPTKNDVFVILSIRQLVCIKSDHSVIFNKEDKRSSLIFHISFSFRVLGFSFTRLILLYFQD